VLEVSLPPVTTCFYPDGRPYWRKLEHNVDRYSRTALSGMVLLGLPVRLSMLSDEESRELLRVGTERLDCGQGSGCGVGPGECRETLRLAEFAAELAYDVILVRTPHFYRKRCATGRC